MARQEADPASVLHAVRAFLAWRRTQPALVEGDIRFLDTPEPVLAFVREHDGQRLLVAFKLSAAPVDCALDLACGEAIDAPGVEQGAFNCGRLLLPEHGAFYARLD